MSTLTSTNRTFPSKGFRARVAHGFRNFRLPHALTLIFGAAGRVHHVPGRGRAVQVDPIKPMLKASTTKRLKLQIYEPLLDFSFNFNMSRYNEVNDPDHDGAAPPGEAVQVDPIKPTLKAPGMTRLKLSYGERIQVLLSNSTCAAAARIPRVLPEDVHRPLRRARALLRRRHHEPAGKALSDMTKRVKPLGHLATSSTKSSKWSVLIGRAGQLSTKS